MDLFFFIKKKEKIPLKTSFDSSAWWYGLLRLYFLRQDYKPSKRLFVVVTQNSKHLEKFQKPIENIKSQQAWRFIAKFNEFKKLYYHTRKERRKKNGWFFATFYLLFVHSVFKAIQVSSSSEGKRKDCAIRLATIFPWFGQSPGRKQRREGEKSPWQDNSYTMPLLSA